MGAVDAGPLQTPPPPDPGREQLQTGGGHLGWHSQELEGEGGIHAAPLFQGLALRGGEAMLGEWEKRGVQLGGKRAAEGRGNS